MQSEGNLLTIYHSLTTNSDIEKYTRIFQINSLSPCCVIMRKFDRRISCLKSRTVHQPDCRNITKLKLLQTKQALDYINIFNYFEDLDYNRNHFLQRTIYIREQSFSFFLKKKKKKEKKKGKLPTWVISNDYLNTPGEMGALFNQPFTEKDQGRFIPPAHWITIA